jgi:hypothetical protein
MIAIGFISRAVSGYLSGFIAEVSLVWTIYTSAIIMFLSAFWVLFLPQNKSFQSADGDQSTDQSNDQKGSDRPSLREAFGSLKGPRITPIITLQILMMGLVVSMLFFFQVYLDENEVRYSLLAIIISTGSIMLSIGSSNSAKISDIIGDKSLSLYLAILLLALLLMSMSIGVLFAIVAYELIQLLRGIIGPIFSKLINQEIPSKVRATTLSIVSAIFTIVILSMEYGSAVLIEQSSFETLFVLLGISLVLVVLVLSQFIPRSPISQISKSSIQTSK